MRSANSVSRTKKRAEPDPQLWPKAGARIGPLEFRRAPLLAAAILFALGEVLARNWHPSSVLLCTVALLAALTLAALRWSPRVALIPVAVLWMAAGLWCAEIAPTPNPQQALLSYADGLSRQVRGRVMRVRELPPRQGTTDQDKESGWWPEKEASEEAAAVGALSVDIQVNGIEEVTPDISRMVPMTGGVRMNVIPDRETMPASKTAALPSLRCGNVVEAPMRLKVPERYHDPAAWQYADYLLAQGVGAHANVRTAKVKLLPESATLTDKADWQTMWQCRIYTAQSWASGRVLGYVRSKANRDLPQVLRLNADDGAMLNAMLFGDRAGLNQTQRVGFERTGSFHLFVVSGMHVGLLAGMVFWAARRMKLHELTATSLTIALTAGYALLTGFGPPVQRALFMVVVFLLARLLSRDRNVLNAVGAAALGVLVWSPGSLFEASFQMTFLAIVAIAGIAVPLGERSFLPYARAASHLRDEWEDASMEPRIAQFRITLRMCSEAFAKLLGSWSWEAPATVVRWTLHVAELALIGAVAELIMVLPMAVYFHRTTMFALPANMFSVPLVAVLLPMSIVTFCAALASPWMAILPGAATALLLHGVRVVIGQVSAVRGADLRVPGPVWWIAILAVAAWALCCWAVRRSRRWAWISIGLLPLVAAMVLWPERAALSSGMMEVTAIDVGQGDSILLASPDGHTMLIDAGGPVGGVTEAAEATSRFDVGDEVVSPYLWSRRLRRLDVLALSHAHSDHMGGMPAVMRNFRPRELWVSIDPNSQAYQALLSEAKKLGVVVRRLHAGDRLAWGGTEVTVLAPEQGYENSGEPANNDSLAMRVQYGRASVLLEGDAEAQSEEAMLANKRIEPVTLLKVGHHGSRTSTTEAFLSAAAPKDAVVSVGKGNTFGHPRFEVIERIAQHRTRFYRTDEFGLTTFLMSRDGEIQAIPYSAVD